ncbi:MAG: Maf-like protein [Cyclobacteriaceae bacterium]|nr:MAG: Maf-like protein [Cyclobacteriaceae bacterium]
MMLQRKLILASTSPRRQFLLREAGFDFIIEKPDADECFPPELPASQVARFLALKKAESFRARIGNEIVLTADTVVILNNEILNKPQNRSEAISMLSRLSGKTHVVITGVCILSAEKEITFDDATEVTFASLTSQEIAFYVDKYKPYDKAGSYGAQDFIGMVGIERINGSYFNVMGLPMHKVYRALKDWA